jgi:hypothetical protein
MFAINFKLPLTQDEGSFAISQSAELTFFSSKFSFGSGDSVLDFQKARFCCDFFRMYLRAARRCGACSAANNDACVFNIREDAFQ